MKQSLLRFTLNRPMAFIVAMLMAFSTTVFTLKTAAITSQALNIGTASDWAQNGITSAVNKGFVPLDLQDDYQNVITRQEFCRMAIKFVEYNMGRPIDTVLADMNVSRNPDAFSDTKDADILAAYALGITNGTQMPTKKRPGLFTPSGEFTREQAATMIMNTCRVLGMDISNLPACDFTDLNTADTWAINGINFVRANGIMSGVSAKPPKFNPKTAYTRQESILTFDRIEWPSFDSKANIDDLIDSVISRLSSIPEGVEEELHIAIKALALNNPVYAPHDVVKMISKNLHGFRKLSDDAAVSAVYAYDGYLEISQHILDNLIENESQNLRFLFAHELTHALNIANKSVEGKGFVFNDWYNEEIKVHGLIWNGRLTEGLTDVYAFSALDGRYKATADRYVTISYIDSPFVYPQEQTAAIMFLNAFGRQNVNKAFFGTQEQYNDFEAYCTKLTGITFRKLMNTVTRTVAWMYTNSYAPDTNDNDVNNEIKKYMNIILEVCEKRSKATDAPLTISEVDKLIASSVQINDKEYMKMYYEKLNSLKDYINNKK